MKGVNVNVEIITFNHVPISILTDHNSKLIIVNVHLQDF